MGTKKKTRDQLMILIRIWQKTLNPIRQNIHNTLDYSSTSHP